jgi:hypothetical protein
MNRMQESQQSPPTMNPTLERYAEGFARARGGIEALVAGLSEEELQWRPRIGRWSIVECLDHLNAGWMVLAKLDRKIAEGRTAGILEDGKFRGTWFGSLYVRAAEPPVRLVRVRAPRGLRPRDNPASVEVVPRVLTLQDEFVLRVRAANGLDVGAIRMSSPISRRLKMTLGEMFAFLAAHERRHLWQAANVRGALAGRRA